MNTTKLISIILAVVLLSACTTTYEPVPDRLLLTAGADTVTTHIGLANGAHEMNPLGPSGAFVAKLVYIFGLRNYVNESDRETADRMVSSMWLGAAVNNLLVVVFPAAGLAPAAVGIGAGYWLYRRSADQQ